MQNHVVVKVIHNIVFLISKQVFMYYLQTRGKADSLYIW